MVQKKLEKYDFIIRSQILWLSKSYFNLKWKPETCMYVDRRECKRFLLLLVSILVQLIKQKLKIYSLTHVKVILVKNDGLCG